MGNPRYLRDRQEVLKALDLRVIDRPIVELIEGFSVLPECFTVQSCYGHFLYAPGQDSHNLERLPHKHDGEVTYRIAYVAFCLENSPRGRALCESLERVSSLDPGYVQFGSAAWFWARYRNSYALQVEPVRHMTRDQVVIEHSEALHIEKSRDRFFTKLEKLLEMCSSETRGPQQRGGEIFGLAHIQRLVVNQAPDHLGGVKLGETEGEYRVDSVLTCFVALVVKEPVLEFEGGAVVPLRTIPRAQNLEVAI